MGSTSSVAPVAGVVHRLPRRTIALYSIGSVGTGGFGTLPGLVLVYYLTDSLGVSALLAGVIVAVAKIWDVLIDPVIGELSDSSARRTGSRAAFMRAGALGLPVFFVLTFAVPHSADMVVRAVWVLVAFIAAATAFSLFQVPYIALPAELTADYDERTRLLTWRVVVLSLAILAFGGGGPALRDLAGNDEQLGYLIMALVAGIVMAIGFYVASLCAPRKDLASLRAAPRQGAAGASDGAILVDESVQDRGSVLSRAGKSYRSGVALLRHNRAFRSLLGAFFAQALATGMMLAAAQYVATWVMKDKAAITFLFVALIAPALLCAPVWGRVSRRVGKERAFGIASVVFIIGCVALFILYLTVGFETMQWAVYLFVAVCGGAYAGMQSLPMAMLPDVISHSLAKENLNVDAGSGSDAGALAESSNSQADRQGANADGSAENHGAGVFGGVWTAGETTGMALGSTILTVVLALTGYVESVGSQTPDQPSLAINGIVVAFCLIPALSIAASLLFLRNYPLRRAQIA